MIANLIFGFFLLCIILGIARAIFMGLFERLFEMYGGFWGTLVAFAINAFEFCFICWLVSFIIPGVDWALGLTLGPIYTIYCWIFNKENKLLSLWFGA